MKKVLALVLALVMVLAVASVAFATTVYSGNGGDKTIKVNNAMIGETYTIYKLFDATTDGTHIAYTLIPPATDIPTQVADIFQKETITVGTSTYDAITVKGTPTDAQVQAALLAWVDAGATEVGHIDCAASPVVFDELTPGYYVIVSSFNDGDATTVEKIIGVSTVSDTTNVYEKNTVEITVVKDGGTDYSIGDTVQYTVTFDGPNYRGVANEARIVTKYVVTDTLPEFLSGAAVTKIKIGTTEYTDTDLNNTNFPGVESFGTTKTFDIPWATKGSGDHDWTSKYPNGTSIEITYTATLTAIVKIDGTTGTGNKNIVDISPVTDTPEGGTPWEEHHTDDHEIYTYGAALKKTDGTDTLAGAKFHFQGLTLTAESGYTKGVYRVTGYDSSSSTYGTEVEVGDDGMLYILGLASSVDLTGEETDPPIGYNKLTSTFTLEPQVMSHTIWSSSEDKYFDANGNLVASSSSATTTTTVTKNIDDLKPAALEIVNNAGTELPSTGGVGTTIFYISGLIMVLGAAVILVARRRADAE